MKMCFLKFMIFLSLVYKFVLKIEKLYLYNHFVITFCKKNKNFDNFLSIFFFLSPLFLTNENREEISCRKSCIK